MSYKGLDLIYRLLSKHSISLSETEGLHPIFKITGLAVSKGEILDYGVSLKPAKTPDTIVLIGCGGTGSHVLPNILQYLKSRELTSNFSKMPKIILIDGDKVEEKNLVRQRFTSRDIGMNKADALARRYSGVFGCKIISSSGYISHSKELLALLEESTYTLFIGAVDNHRARLIIWDTCEAFAKKGNQAVWIDGGNETHHGQVILGSWNLETDSKQAWTNASIGASISSIDLPHFFNFFPEEILLVGGTPTTPENQCAINVAENPQTIHANATSAQAISNLVTQVFEKSIRTYFISFDSLTGNTKAEILTRIKIANVLEMMNDSNSLILSFLESLPGTNSEVLKGLLPGIIR